MSLRSTLRKAAGLLVELPDDKTNLEALQATSGSSNENVIRARREVQGVYDTFTEDPKPPTKTVEQIVRDSNGPNLDTIEVHPQHLPSVTNADGSVNFNAIYLAASLPSVPFTAESVLSMFSSLPDSLPLDVKRQTVAVSIESMGKAIGASAENIVADASRKMAALAAYTDHLGKETTELCKKAELEIAALEAQISERRKLIELANARLKNGVNACTGESEKLDDVLEFFSLDVPPSRYAPDTAQDSPAPKPTP